jgi:hypothetical protein
MTPSPILALPSFFLLLTMSVFLMVRKTAPPTLGTRTENSTHLSVMMPVVVSLATMAAGVCVILNHTYATGAEEWGYGIVGLVVGYGLRAPVKTQLTHSVKRHSDEALFFLPCVAEKRFVHARRVFS